VPAAAISALAALRADAVTKNNAAESAQANHTTTVDAQAAFSALEAQMRDIKRRWFFMPPLVEGDFAELLLSAPDGTKTAIGIPLTRPVIYKIVALGGCRVEIWFRDETEERSRAIPYGMNGCLLSYIYGDQRVTEWAAFTTTKLMTASPFILQLPEEALRSFFSCAARWQNETADLGPWSEAASVVVA